MAVALASVRRGAVVIIRLPRDKARPAVVVRSDLMGALPYATMLPITTELRPGISMRIDVAPSQQTELRIPSQIMVDWPQTVRMSDAGEVIGHLDQATRRVVTRQIAVLLGIGVGIGRRRPQPAPQP